MHSKRNVKKFSTNLKKGASNELINKWGRNNFQSKKFNFVDKFPQVSFLITNTKVPRETSKIVSQIRQRRGKVPKVMKVVLEVMEELVSSATEGIEKYNCDAQIDKEIAIQKFNETIQNLVDINQGLLNAIGGWPFQVGSRH